MEAKQPLSSRFAGAMLPQSSSSKPGGKKLVIKQYAEKPKLPETFDKDTWERLSSAVAVLLQQMPASHSFEELYACSSPQEKLTTNRSIAPFFEHLVPPPRPSLTTSPAPLFDDWFQI